MGLDVYFDRRAKKSQADVERQTSYVVEFLSKLSQMECCVEDITCLLLQLKDYADSSGSTFDYEFKRAIESYLRGSCYSKSREEVAYFRKFYFLRSYFDYTQDMYGEDLVITRNQIEDLFYRAEAAIKSTVSYFNKRGYYVQRSVLDDKFDLSGGYLQIRGHEMDSADYEEADSLCAKFFDEEENLFINVCTLYQRTSEILQDTDFDMDEIVMTADW